MLARLILTGADIHRWRKENSIDKLKEKIRDNKEISEEIKKITFYNLLPLINIFEIRNNDWKKFEKAVYDYDFPKIFECLNFDICQIIKSDMISSPLLLNNIIDILKQKTKELEQFNTELESDSIITRELDIAKQRGDKKNKDLMNKLLRISCSETVTRNQELFFEKSKNKDWKAALNLARNRDECKDRLIHRVFTALNEQINLLASIKPDSQRHK